MAACYRAILAGLALFIAVPSHGQAPAPEKPEARLSGAEYFVNNSGTFVRWRFDVVNKADFDEALFTAAPDLPPCGTNTNAARTWVDLFREDGRRIYGFCALAGRDQLSTLWFATPLSEAPPSGVHIVLNDRRTNTRYRSELVDLSAPALASLASTRLAAGDRPGAFRLLERALSIQVRNGPVDPVLVERSLNIARSYVPSAPQ